MESEQVDIEEVNMGILATLGDFLLGVGAVLLGVAAMYHVLARTLLDDKKDQDAETRINEGFGTREE
jgi:hypothetical protein